MVFTLDSKSLPTAGLQYYLYGNDYGSSSAPTPGQGQWLADFYNIGTVSNQTVTFGSGGVLSEGATTYYVLLSAPISTPAPLVLGLRHRR